MIVSNIIQDFPPKEPEKILKEIKEIDYVSPLEETEPKHSLMLYLEPSQHFSNFERRTFITNTNGGNTYVQTQEETYIRIPESRNRLSFGLGYRLDTRYFSFFFETEVSDSVSSEYNLSQLLKIKDIYFQWI